MLYANALSLLGRLGVGEQLMIVNVSQLDDDVYQCVAFNGVPPPHHRLIRLNVHCTFTSLIPSHLTASLYSAELHCVQ